MKWSKKKPDKPGFYWVQWNGNPTQWNMPTVARVFWAFYYGSGEKELHVSWEWECGTVPLKSLTPYRWSDVIPAPEGS